MRVIGKTIALTVVATLTLGALAVPTARAQDGGYEGHDWPHWRGPQHDGISRETGWVQDWSGDGPPIAWRAQIGRGFSSFAVVGSRVYTMGHEGGEETVYCFDADSGDLIWEHGYEAALLDRMHEGGPTATPTVHEGRVYTLGKEGRLLCLNADDGEVIWRKEMQEVTGLEAPPQWGFASSGVVVDDTIVFQAGSTIAFDQASGEVVWRSKEYDPSYATPAPIEFDGKPALASLNSFGLAVVDARNGEELSTFPWETRFDTNATTPIVADGKAFLATGYGKGCALVDLQPGQADLLYRKQERGNSLSNHINTSVLYDGHIYGFDGNTNRNKLGELVCMDFATGEEKWRHRGLGVGSLTISDGKLIILSDEGTLVLAEATPEGYQETGRKRILEGKTWTVPVLSHGRIYARTAEGEMVAVDVQP